MTEPYIKALKPPVVSIKTMDDAETIRIACVAGPEALRTLVQTQGMRLAVRFALEGPHLSFMHVVLRAVVMHGAPLDVLDVLEEQWPGLQVSDTQNGLTELIHMEAWMYRHDLLPNSELRSSIRATVQDVLRRMPASLDIYTCRRYFHTSLGNALITLPFMAMHNRAYYTYEALNCPDALDKLTTNNPLSTILPDSLSAFLPEVRLHIPETMQEVILNLIHTAPRTSLTRLRHTLLDSYESMYNQRRQQSSDTAKYIRRDVLLVIIGALQEEEVRPWHRMRLFLKIFQPVFEYNNGVPRIIHLHNNDISRDVFGIIASFLQY